MFLASNLGILVKSSENGMYHVVVNDIRTSEPAAGTEIKLYNYQQQLIGSGKTNNDGFTDIQADGVPFSVLATGNGSKGYLRMAYGNS